MWVGKEGRQKELLSESSLTGELQQAVMGAGAVGHDCLPLMRVHVPARSMSTNSTTRRGARVVRSVCRTLSLSHLPRLAVARDNTTFPTAPVCECVLRLALLWCAPTSSWRRTAWPSWADCMIFLAPARDIGTAPPALLCGVWTGGQTLWGRLLRWCRPQWH